MEPATLPPLDIVGPDGQPLTVRAVTRDDTVGELAERLDVESLWTTRRLEAGERLAEVDDLRIGTRVLAHDPGGGSAVGGVEFEVSVVAGPAVTTGRTVGVGRHVIGRAPLAGVRVEDPTIEPYQALLVIDADGAATVRQLCGSVPIRVGAGQGEGAVDADGATVVTIGASQILIRRRHETASVESASSGAESTGSIAAHPSDPWRRIVRRAPYASHTWDPPTLTAPVAPNEPRPPSSTGLVGAAVTAGGAVVIARVMDNAMFMLFAALGVVAAVVTFLVGVATTRRHRRRVRARHADALADFGVAVDALNRARRAHHRLTHRTVADSLDEVFGDRTRLWQRRLAADAGDRPDDQLRAVVGTGTHRWVPPIEIPDRSALDSTLLGRVEGCAQLRGVAAPVTLRPGEAVAFHGARESARSIVRSVVVQFATWVGPADWQLVVVSDDRRAWSWAEWLPHGVRDGALVVLDGSSRNPGDVLAERLESVEPSRRTVVVTDQPHLYAARTGALRRFLTASGGASLVVVDTDATVPAVCRRVLTVGAVGSASWSGEPVDVDDSVSISFAGITRSAADRAARRLASLVDPEDDGAVGGSAPLAVSFGDLIPDTSIDSIVRRWKEGGDDPAPAAPLGMSIEGRVDIDLVRDGPHGLIAGTTGAGKSELLRSLVLGLAASVGPDHVHFVLVDYKGGSTFDACTRLPHTVGVVTDLDDGLAERALVSLDAELRRRERLLRAAGASDLAGYRARCATLGHGEAIARLVVVIDEFATLAKELPDFLSALVGIAQRGRSLGVHLLLATQRPAGVVNDDIRANTNLRLALRLHDRPDALDVVGDDLPATFPRGVPGRCALRLGPDELVVFQAARCTGPDPGERGTGGMIVDRGSPVPTSAGLAPGEADRAVEPADGVAELDTVVAAIIEAAAALGFDSPRRPWIEPLPFPLAHVDEPVSAADGGSRSIGWIDDPAHQRRLPLVWGPGDGALALIGSVGSGRTSTLIALVATACTGATPDELHVYVVDAHGDDGLASLAALAHCGAVVGRNDVERLHRLLARIVATIDGRVTVEGRGDAGPTILVVIDGYSSVKTALGELDRHPTFELLHRVVHDGPAAGISLAITDDGATATTTLPITERWVFHLDDPGTARTFGVRTAPVGAGTPGRLRIAGSGLEAQVAQGAAGLAALPSRDERVAGGPTPIEVLASVIRVGEIRVVHPATTVGPDRIRILVGVDAEDLGPAELEVVDGDHVLVVGGPRAGVSSALERVATGWIAAADERGDPCRLVRCHRGAPIALATVDDPSMRTALVIDDAHRVGDDAGLLAAIARGEFPHVIVLAAGRADVIRSAYGHWTREVAKSRCGIAMTSRGDPDGDVLAAQIPRRPLVAARPGLAWIVDTGPLRNVQIALDP